METFPIPCHEQIPIYKIGTGVTTNKYDGDEL
jgi:hypothetical protein